MYFEALLAYYSCTKANRPWAKPRYGSVCERLFGTANTQLVHTLTGNTQITKQVRQVTKSVDPKQHAVWTLGDLYRYLMTWAYEVYDTTPHPALDMSPLQQWKYCYERSIGCVGVLKDWLTRALAEAIERGEKTLGQSLLEQHALSVDRCTQMVTEAAAGEAALTEDDQAAYRLRVRLGLEVGPAEQQEPARRSEPSPRRRLRVGQRNPTRDPVARVTRS